MAFSEEQINQLKLLLEVQASGYSDSIDRLHREIINMKKIYDNKICELERSLEFSQNTIDELQKKLVERDQFDKYQAENREALQSMQSQLNKQEDYTRRYNLRIDGVNESGSETNEQTQVKIQKILKDYFDLDNVEIDTAHRIKSSNDHHRNKTVIVRLTNLRDRDHIMRNTNKLKNTNIYINEDLSDGTMKTRKAKLPELKAARDAGQIAYFIRDRLVVKNRIKLNSQSQKQETTPSQRNVPALVAHFNPHAQTFNENLSPLPSPMRRTMETTPIRIQADKTNAASPKLDSQDSASNTKRETRSNSKKGNK